ncbi:MAG: hypothetical protein WA814_13775 [Candidatus Baltobacteraceae bacterium]
MILSNSVKRLAAATVAAAALAACGSAQLAPAGVSPPAARLVVERSGGVKSAGDVRPNRAKSWMLAEATRCPFNGNIPPCGLLYVTNYSASDVLVYRDNKLVGTLTGFEGPDGACNDAAGDVWITNNLGESAVEYAHGGTNPIATMSDPNAYPIGCSVDPTTGDLAVANIYTKSSSQGSIAIFAQAKAPPKYYFDPDMYYVYFCGYDNQGNLYVDGRNARGNFQFAELSKGSLGLTNISLSAPINFPGNVRWDGRHVAVGDQEYEGNGSAIYRTTGAGGQVVGHTVFGEAQDVVGFVIRGRSVIAPDANLNDIGLYIYPAGGAPVGRIGGFDAPYGAAISQQNQDVQVPAIWPSPAPRVRKGPKPRGWISPAAKTGRVFYVADGDRVLIYPQKGKNPQPIGSITDAVHGAYGLCVDRAGNLYVVNDGSSSVTVYPRGSTSPSITYAGDLDRPLYPIVDSAGDLFVGNANNGNIVEYLAGKSAPYQTFATAGSEVDGMDFDAAGNLYVAYRGDGSGGIEEFPAGSTQGQILGMQLNQPQEIVVTNDGAILATETGGTNRIDVFPPGSTTPSYELPVSGVPTELSITEPEHKLFFSTLSNGTIFDGPYPLINSNGSPNAVHVKVQAGGGVQGMALSDGQSF